MLAICFSLSVFSTILWGFYSLSFLFKKLEGASFLTLDLVDASLYMALILVPIFIIWVIAVICMQLLLNKTLNKNLFHLFQQMKKNQDYTDVIARLMLETERHVKDGFVFNKIDILIADLNEILSEIIYKTKIASKEQIDMLWQKAQNGGKWVFAKVIIEVWQNQSNFLTRILERAQSDVVLSGSILEFCARYLNLVALLEKHDKDKVFLNLIEAGVLGKVFVIFAPLDDEIKKRRSFADVEEATKKKLEEDRQEEYIAQSLAKKDEFSAALERSLIEESAEQNSLINDAPKEWEGIKTSEFKSRQSNNGIEVNVSMGKAFEEKEENAYPFGNWMK